MKKIVKISAAIAGMLFAFASCGTTSNVEGSEEETASAKESESKKTDKKKIKVKKYDQAAFDTAFAAKDYDTCLAYLEVRKSDLILNDVDTYMLQYLNKDYQSSGRTINDTQSDMSQIANGMTAAGTVKAALIGENSVEYYGPTYERMLTYSMKAVNNLKAGSVSGAKGVMDDFTGNYKAEIADIVQQQKEVDAADYSDQINKTNELLSKVNLGFDLSKLSSPEGSDKYYENSAFLSYLGTIVYAANGDSTHAADFQKVLRTLNSNVDVSKDIAVPAGKGRIDVVSLTDEIGKRSEGGSGLVQVLNYQNVVEVNFKIVYPDFVAPEHKISVKKVTLSDGQESAFTLVEDFDEAVKMDVLSRQKGAYNRSLTRNVVKNGASIATCVAALAKGGTAAKLAVPAFNKAMEKVISLEKADVRQGTYFPNKASAAGFTVAPGTYTVTVEYSDGSKDVIDNVVVSAGKPTIVVSEKMN